MGPLQHTPPQKTCQLARGDADALEVGHQLIREFLEDLFGQSLRLVLVSVILDELDDVSLTPVSLAVDERLRVTVQFLHHSEFVLSHSHDDDAHRHAAQFLADDLLGQFHVVDRPVRDYHQHHILVRSLLLLLFP